MGWDPGWPLDLTLDLPKTVFAKCTGLATLDLSKCNIMIIFYHIHTYKALKELEISK